MRERCKTRLQLRAMLTGVATMMLVVLVICLTTITSHAEEGKVTATSAKIRASADASSAMIGSAMQGDILTITGEVADADGVHSWYQVTFEENKTGYIRSDLMQKVGAGTTTTPTAPSAPAATATPSSPASDVTALQPIGAKVKGELVRVRSNASTSGNIVTTVKKGVALTVVGMATDSDQKKWWQVNFSDANGQVTGFIREDFVTLEGEPVPADQVPEDPVVDPPVDPVEPDPPVEPEPVKKDYETQFYEGEGWYLMDYTQESPVRWPIEELKTSGTENLNLYKDSQKELKTTKIIMYILVALAIVLALVATLLFFKIRDMMDAAYFEEVEKETVRRRQGATGRSSMPTVGAGNRTAGSSQQKTQSAARQRPSGSSQQRPAGSGGQRPAGSSQQRPAGSGGQRPAGSSQQRPAGSSQQRPAGSSGQRPAGSGHARPTGQQSSSVSRETQSAPRQPKNTLAEDDEFDFEYLNWDGEEDN